MASPPEHSPVSSTSPSPSAGGGRAGRIVRRVLLGLLSFPVVPFALLAGLMITVEASEPQVCGYVPSPGGWAAEACAEQRETFVAPVPVWWMFGLALAPLPALVAGWVWRDRWWVVALATVVVLGAVPLLMWWVE